MSTGTDDRLDHLDVLRGFAILMVVAGHAFGYVAGAQLTNPPTMLETIFLAVSGMAVPAFFMVDGFLASRSLERKGAPKVRDVALKSARRLLIPWVIFNILSIAFRVLYEWKGGASEFLVLRQPPRVVLENILYSRISMQLYFLPALYLIRVAAALLAPIFGASLGRALLLLLGYRALILLLAVPLESDFVTQAIIGLQHFLLGFVIERAERSGRRAGTLALASASLVLIAQTLAPWPDSVGNLTAVLAQIGLVIGLYLLSQPLARIRTPLLWLGTHTMEIYLLHAAALMKILQVILSKFIANPVALITAITVVDVAICVVITLVLERFSWSKPLFGKMK